MTDPVIHVRAAVRADADAVQACVEAAYKRYVARIGKRPAPMLDDYAKLIAGGVVSVATISEQLAGLIVMWPESDHFYIDNVAVLPSAQGDGIGRRLLDHADTCARAAGHSEVRLYTNLTMVENISYYPRRGFVETHRAFDAGYERVYFSRPVASDDRQ